MIRPNRCARFKSKRTCKWETSKFALSLAIHFQFVNTHTHTHTYVMQMLVDFQYRPRNITIKCYASDIAQKVKWYKENEHIKTMVYGQVASDSCFFFPSFIWFFILRLVRRWKRRWSRSGAFFYFHNHSHHAPKDRRSIRRCSYHRLELRNQPNIQRFIMCA